MVVSAHTLETIISITLSLCVTLFTLGYKLGYQKAKRMWR